MEVTELVKRHKTANPFIIAEYENIKVRFVPLPSDLQGLMLSTPNNKPMMWINDNIRDRNLRYLVMAHKLKHSLNHYGHYGLDGFYTAAYNGKGKLENDADWFAMDLILLFYQEKYENVPETFDTLKATFGIKEEMRKYY